jgi:CP family cyanate transporter-like MFS transporter
VTEAEAAAGPEETIAPDPVRGAPVAGVVLVLAIFVLALNLRMGISSVGPIIPVVVHDLGTTLVFASLLTTAPVVMMGIASPVSARIAARVGIEWTVVASLVVIALATAVRLWTGAPWMLLASALILGSGIAAGSTMLPAVVRRYFPARGALMTGVYTVGINAGAGIAAFGSPRLTGTLASTWRGALAVWAAIAVVAGVLWLVIATRTRPAPRRLAVPTPRRSRQAWMAALVFGLQGMVYYGILAWLASLYEDLGWSKGQAGLLLFYFTILQIVGAMTAALLVQRTGRLGDGLRITALTMAAGLVLVAMTPLSAPWLWVAVLGLGAGGIFPVTLMIPLAMTRSVDEARHLTASMLCYGYLLAATGPFVVSLVRGASAGFVIPFLVLAALAVACAMLAHLVVDRGAKRGGAEPSLPTITA